MKKLCLVLSLAGVMAAPSLFASWTITLTQNTGQYSYGTGGEFRASGTVVSAVDLSSYSAATAGAGYFQTFCIESTEYFTPGATYNVTINDRAIYGGQGPTGDPLSIGTAWLYSQFAAGSLSGYTYAYGANRTLSANVLQQAIWWLEGEGGTKNAFVIAAETALGLNDTTIKADANGAYGVVALNLYDKDGNRAQDQLGIVPEPTTVVAGVLLLLPFGASTLRILRKSRAFKD